MGSLKTVDMKLGYGSTVMATRKGAARLFIETKSIVEISVPDHLFSQDVQNSRTAIPGCQFATVGFEPVHAIFIPSGSFSPGYCHQSRTSRSNTTLISLTWPSEKWMK